MGIFFSLEYGVSWRSSLVSTSETVWSEVSDLAVSTGFHSDDAALMVLSERIIKSF